MAEWQTQWTQNPPPFGACRFESGLGHQEPGLTTARSAKPHSTMPKSVISIALLFSAAIAVAGPQHFIVQPDHVLTQADIAAIKEMEEGAVAQKLSRSRKKIKKVMEVEGRMRP